MWEEDKDDREVTVQFSNTVISVSLVVIVTSPKFPDYSFSA